VLVLPPGGVQSIPGAEPGEFVNLSICRGGGIHDGGDAACKGNGEGMIFCWPKSIPSRFYAGAPRWGGRAAFHPQRNDWTGRKAALAKLLRHAKAGLLVNEHINEPGDVVFRHACKLGLEGIVSKRLGSRYRSGRSRHWIKSKNPKHPAVKREAEEDWGR